MITDVEQFEFGFGAKAGHFEAGCAGILTGNDPRKAFDLVQPIFSSDKRHREAVLTGNVSGFADLVLQELADRRPSTRRRISPLM